MAHCSEKRGCSSEIESNRIQAFEKIDRKTSPRFTPGVCLECHKIPSENVHMKACSRCRLVWYCGGECQKKNWTYHKNFCKAASSVALEFETKYIMEGVKEVVNSPDGLEFHKYLIAITEAISTRLKRKVDSLEQQILWFPKVCEICKEGNPEVLKACTNCFMVFYCSKIHFNQDSKRHKNVCSDYYLFLQIQHLMSTRGNPIPVPLPFKIPKVSEYKPLSGTMKDFIKPLLDPTIDCILSESISYPFSLIYALEHTGLHNGSKKIGELTELTVLMGDTFNTTWRTMAHNPTWEYMFHLLPKLKTFHLIICEGIPIPSRKPLDQDLCSDCKSRKCKFSITLAKDYQEYESSKYYRKPDVIYNHKATNDDGTESYLPLPNPKIPLILLGTGKESLKEILCEIQKREKLDIVLPMQMNPFHALRPIKLPLCLQDMENCGVLQYPNYYIVALYRRLKIV